MDMNLIGERIRSVRRQREMSAAVLAEAIGIAVESLGHIECGARKPGLQTLIKIADALDISLDYISGRTPSPAAAMVQQELGEDTLTPQQRALLLDLMEQLIPVVKKHS